LWVRFSETADVVAKKYISFIYSIFGIDMSEYGSKRQLLFIMSVVAGSIGIIGGGLQASRMLRSIGVTSVFTSLSLPGTDKVNFALYLTFPAAALAIVLWAGASMLRGHTKRGGMIAFAAMIPCLSALLLPSVLGYPSSAIGLAATLVGLALAGLLGFMGIRTPGVEAEERMLLTPVEIALVAVFSALTAVLTGTTGLMLPSPTGGYTHIGDTAIYVAALLFGIRVGGLVGVIGPVAADLFVGYPRWFVTVIAHGTQGFVAGLGKGRNTVVQVAVLAFSGFIMATTYFFVNIFIKGYPVAIISYARDLFGQSLVSIVLGLILTKAAEKALPSLMR
jgi:uncharacterized membrane protein